MGLKAISAVYPQTSIELCIVHMVRKAMRFVSWKDYKGLTSDLKAIYQTSTEEAAQSALQAFATKWDHKYPTITKPWQDNWANLSTIFAYPPQIRKAIYTTNAIESLNSVIRHVTNKRKIFPSDDSARKIIYLAVMNASKKWTMPIQNWREAMNWFMIQFDERINAYLQFNLRPYTKFWDSLWGMCITKLSFGFIS